jgi:hypothetical protein
MDYYFIPEHMNQSFNRPYGNVLIRLTHPDLKGSFTCLGVRFNCLNHNSMRVCFSMIAGAALSDKKTAKKEIEQAQEDVKNFTQIPYLKFLYDAVDLQQGTGNYT